MPEKELLKQLDELHDWRSSKATQETFGVPGRKDLLDLFVKQHYLTREKDTRTDQHKESVYEVGPRAFLEIGRKQLMSFAYEAAGMQVDSAAIQAIDDEQTAEQEDEEVGESGQEEG